MVRRTRVLTSARRSSTPLWEALREAYDTLGLDEAVSVGGEGR
jgi:hypothetical protein